MSQNDRQPDHPIDPLFTRRWSPRAFTGETIDQATLMSLFEAARWAPSASNLQPWRFVYAHRDTPAWGPIHAALVEFNRVWTAQASALIVVLSKTQGVPPGKSEPQPIRSHSFDAGAAWASLAFQATLAGWYTHAMGGYDGAQLRAAIGAPEDIAIEAVVAVGRLGDKKLLPEPLQARELPSTRVPVAQLVSEGRYRLE
jgi:nitroreductase